MKRKYGTVVLAPELKIDHQGGVRTVLGLEACALTQSEEMTKPLLPCLLGQPNITPTLSLVLPFLLLSC